MDTRPRTRRDHWLFVRFMQINNLSKYIEYFPNDMTISQLKCISNDDLLTVFGIQSDEDRALLVKAAQEHTVKKIDQSDHESDCGIADASSLLRSKIRPPSSSINRRHSIHRDILINRKLLRSGSERMKINTNIRNSSLKSHNASLDVPLSNLLKIRNRHLGHSAPDIISSSASSNAINVGSTGMKKISKVEKCFVPSYQNAVTKKDKFDSPKVSSVLQQIRNTRRMSINSVVSSDWSAFPSPTSAFSSHNSSQERLNSSSGSTSTATMQLLINNNNSGGGGGGGRGSGDCGGGGSIGSGDKISSCNSNLLTTFDDSNAWNERFEFDKINSVDSMFQARNSSMSPLFFRPRAQSFTNSPVETDNDLIALNEFYRERFPKAIEEMELKLVHYLGKHSVPSHYPHIKSDGSASFIYHQLNELASDCLEKSRENQISSQYLAGFVNNMEQLLENARLRTSSPCDELAQMIQELLIIISRPARLLECLEFDPKDFYRKLEETELEVKKICDSEVVSYIFNKLGLEKPSVEQCLHRHLHNQHQFFAGCQGKDCEFSDNSSNNSSFDNRAPCLNIDVDCHSLTSPFCDHQLHPLDQNKNLLSSSSSSSSSPPQESDFETIKLISNGAYGAVLLVRHKSSRKLFAMKKLLKSNLVLRNMVEQVFAERDILTFSDNPFVVGFCCSFETKKFLCMVLEYVEGGDCGALLKNISGPLPLDMARLYFAETVLALEYLHNFGIVHRDLKPDNLLITSLGHIKLTDFGLSKIGLMKSWQYLGPMGDSKKFLDNQVFGTPEYIAPEVILRQEYGKPVDWWSMGIILYQFLVGCVPFTGDTPEEVFSEIVTGEIEWPEEEEFRVCDDAVDIIEALLIKDPTQRLGSSGSSEVKAHDFFREVDWNGLLRQKTQFAPQLVGEDDTSYFDERTDRYQHQIDDSGGGEDDDEDDESDLFKSFSTCSPRYNRTEKIFEIGKTHDDIRLDLMQSDFNNDENKQDNIESTPKAETVFEGEDDKVSQQKSETDLISMEPIYDESDNLQATNQKNDAADYDESLLRNNASIISLPGRPHSLSGSSMSETSEKKLMPRATNLKLTSSLKRTREAMITKSSSSSSLSNYASTPTRGKAPHRLVKQLSRESSGSSFDDSSSLIENSPKIVGVTRNREGFGFNIRALKVFNRTTNKNSFQHIIMAIEKGSPAHDAGMCVGDRLTHVNNVSLSGMNHSQVVKLILQQTIKSGQKTNSEKLSATNTLGRKNRKNVFELVEKNETDKITAHSGTEKDRPLDTQDASSTSSTQCRASREKSDDNMDNRNICKSEVVRKNSLTIPDNRSKSNVTSKRTAQSVCNIYTACNEMTKTDKIKNKAETKNGASKDKKDGASSKEQKNAAINSTNHKETSKSSSAAKGIKYFMKHTFSCKRSNSTTATTKWYDKEESKNISHSTHSSKELKKTEEKSHDQDTATDNIGIHSLGNISESMNENNNDGVPRPINSEKDTSENQLRSPTNREEVDGEGAFSNSSPTSPASPTSYQCVEFRVIPTAKVKRSFKINRKFGSKRRNSEFLSAPRSLLIQQGRTCTLKRNNTQKWYLANNNGGFSSSDSGSASMSPTLQKHSEVIKCPSHHRCLVTPISCIISKQQAHSSSTSKISRPDSLTFNKRRISLGGSQLSPLVFPSSCINHNKNKQGGSYKETGNLEINAAKHGLARHVMKADCPPKIEIGDILHLSEDINDLNIHHENSN